MILQDTQHRTRTNADGSVNCKYGCYDADADILTWLREGDIDESPTTEAQTMDWAVDIAYSVHDVDDGIVSGHINLNVLWDLVELAEKVPAPSAAPPKSFSTPPTPSARST